MEFHTIDFTGSNFIECVFENCSFDQLNLYKCELMECLAKNCSIKNSNLSKPDITELQCNNNLIHKINFEWSFLNNCRFVKTELNKPFYSSNANKVKTLNNNNMLQASEWSMFLCRSTTHVLSHML